MSTATASINLVFNRYLFNKDDCFCNRKKNDFLPVLVGRLKVKYVTELQAFENVNVLHSSYIDTRYRTIHQLRGMEKPLDR